MMSATLNCPACSDHPHLDARTEDGGVSLLECPTCAGLWMDQSSYSALTQKAAAKLSYKAPAERTPVTGLKSQFYRACPVCHIMMSRINFGDTSGILVDVCASDGIWFDAQELTQMVKWLWVETYIGRGAEVPKISATEPLKRAEGKSQKLRAEKAKTLVPAFGENTDNTLNHAHWLLELLETLLYFFRY